MSSTIVPRGSRFRWPGWRGWRALRVSAALQYCNREVRKQRAQRERIADVQRFTAEHVLIGAANAEALQALILPARAERPGRAPARDAKRKACHGANQVAVHVAAAERDGIW